MMEFYVMISEVKLRVSVQDSASISSKDSLSRMRVTAEKDCCFCHAGDETQEHLFVEYDVSQFFGIQAES